jgi:HEAT repeat protein
MLIEFIRRPVVDPLRTRAIQLLGTPPETPTKNTLLTEIVRSERETGATRQAALGALAMSRSAAMLPVFQTLFETLLERDLKSLALRGISRNDNSDGAAPYLIHVADTEKDQQLRKSAIFNLGRVAGQKSLTALTATIDGGTDVELQKTAVTAIGRRPKDEAVPILIRTARNHPSMEVRKTAIRVLGQTGDERAIALFSELLSKD